MRFLYSLIISSVYPTLSFYTATQIIFKSQIISSSHFIIVRPLNRLICTLHFIFLHFLSLCTVFFIFSIISWLSIIVYSISSNFLGTYYSFKNSHPLPFFPCTLFLSRTSVHSRSNYCFIKPYFVRVRNIIGSIGKLVHEKVTLDLLSYPEKMLVKAIWRL